MAFLADGSNLDDQQDYRPGIRALKELAVRSPLTEAGLTKSEVRRLSRALGLASWDKPSYACLATRIPYGSPLTPEKLRQVDAGRRLHPGTGPEPARYGSVTMATRSASRWRPRTCPISSRKRPVGRVLAFSKNWDFAL